MMWALFLSKHNFQHVAAQDIGWLLSGLPPLLLPSAMLARFAIPLSGQLAIPDWLLLHPPSSLRNYLTGCLASHLTVHLAIYLIGYWAINLTAHLASNLTGHLAINLTGHLAINLTDHLSIHLTEHLAIQQAGYLAIHLGCTVRRLEVPTCPRLYACPRLSRLLSTLSPVVDFVACWALS